MRQGFDVAQVCRNGHVIATTAGSSPEFRQSYCTQCGEPTIMACEACDTAIRGYFHSDFIGGFDYAVPGFCYNCGKPYPWTSTKLAAARELADTLDALTVEERQNLKSDLDDLVRDTPRTPVAQSRTKRALAKVGKETLEGFKSILVDLVSETVKKSVFGP